MKSILIIALMGISLVNYASGDEKKPVFVEKIGSFISNSITYPEKAIEDKKEGIVYVSFEISENLAVTNVLIEEGVSTELDQSAIDIVALLKVDENQFVSGKKYILPVKFVIR